MSTKLSKTLQNFLDKNKIKYDVLEHRTVYTALDKAATLHIKSSAAGKTVVVALDNKNYALGLIPANKNLDKKKALATFNKSLAAKYKKIDFVSEKWMKANIKGVKLGATPPFGALYRLSFFIDNLLLKQPKIIINGGTYEISLRLAPGALLKLNPEAIKGSFSMAKR